MSDLAAALMVAIHVHADQRDKQGEPYLLHVLRVVEAVDGERAKVLAALHDVWEDAGVAALDPEEVFERDGIFIANSLEVLTRSKAETYAEYIQAIADGHSATWVAEIREVKLADLRDNLGRIPPVDATWVTDSEAKSWASLKVRYEKAIATLEGAA
jgi:(p)ppGpp synthase/HD superfamily hydrolase